MKQKLDFETLKSHLFSASDILRKKLNPEEYRPVIMTILFIKKLNDEYESNVQKLLLEGKSEKEARKKFNHTFRITKDANWKVLFNAKKSIGQRLNQISRAIEEENPELEGVLTSTKFDDKRNFPDNTMTDLMIHFNKYDLSDDNLIRPDIFGDAYEYMLAEFASETKKKGGQFYTPHEVVSLLVRLTKPKEGMKICDPTCGSGGMLIQSWGFVKEKQGNADNLVLHGQESNFQTVGMAKMNLVLHGIANFKIVHEDVLEKPLLQEGGKLNQYDRILANYPFSENWKASGKENDPYKRFRLGIPPAKGKADFAFIQHMYSVLNSKGKAAIISSQGVLFRGSTEAKIRKALFEEDAVEAIIALPEKLFYGTGIPGCILLLNKNKPKDRKGKILFVYAAKDYKEEKVRYTLRDDDIKKIVSAVEGFKDIDRYCHIADKTELEENEYNFNVPRYVDISEPEEEIDIQDAYDEVKIANMEQEEIKKRVEADLKGTKHQIMTRKGYKIVKGDFRENFLIPNEWEISPLQNLCRKIKSGGTPKSDEKTYYNGNIPFSSIIDMSNSEKYLEKTQKTISKSGLENSNAWIVPKNSLLYSMYATIGKPIINKIDTTTHQGILGILINIERMDNDFLFYALQIIRRKLLRYFLTNTQSNMNLKISKNLKIIHPQKISEQQKIASILSNVDACIEATQKVIEKTEKLKKGLMQQLLTRGIGHTKFKKVKWYFDTKIKIPKDWLVLDLEKLSKVRQGLQIPISDRFNEFKKNRLPYITVKSIHSNEFNEYIENPNERVICTENDILFTRTGNTGEIITNIKGVFHNNFFLIDYDQNKITKDYMIISLKQSKIQEITKSLAGSTTIPDLNHGDFYKIKITVPPLPEQQKIASILSGVDAILVTMYLYLLKCRITNMVFLVTV